MVRPDILGGLKNALERGESLDRAVNSFVDAGYDPKEVKEAALKFVGKENAPVIVSRERKPKAVPIPENVEDEEKVKSATHPSQDNREKSKRKAGFIRIHGKVIALSAILAIIVALLIITLILR